MSTAKNKQSDGTTSKAAKQANTPDLDGSEAQAEAKRILDRVNRESEQVGFSNLARQLDPARDEDDPIERLGKRIGRSLGFLFMIGLVVYLVFTYVLPA